MDERGRMHRPAAYSYPVYPAQVPQQSKQYPTAHSTSSAFSASANPNEDWTKISDLAERRRIQNRIAQRNYRKKLKRRLEDLERRAGSSSASPEQTPSELAVPGQASRAASREASRPRSSCHQDARDSLPEASLTQHYSLPTTTDMMFGHQATRQLSVSPPPFSYSVPPTGAVSYQPYESTQAYCTMPPSSMGMPLYPQYVPSQQTAYVPGMPTPYVKDEFGSEGDDMMNPFSVSYASISESYPYATPPLSDTFDYSQAGSPPESHYTPSTPPSVLPSTPPMQAYDKS